MRVKATFKMNKQEKWNQFYPLRKLNEYENLQTMGWGFLLKSADGISRSNDAQQPTTM